MQTTRSVVRAIALTGLAGGRIDVGVELSRGSHLARCAVGRRWTLRLRGRLDRLADRQLRSQQELLAVRRWVW